MSKALDNVVEVAGVCKDFRSGFGFGRKRVLHDISFNVRRGEIFGFVGPNGAGKTTTLKILMGLIRASGGTAKVLGHGVNESRYRRHVGFLPENPYFYDYLSGVEFLRFYARVSGVERAAESARIAELLEWVGLSHAGDARLRTYSKGMLQRVGLAQALVHDPQVVFLDEPMSGLDPIGRMEIRELIVRLRSEGKTIFMNTHILPDAEMLCDRVAVIVKGRIRYEGSVSEFLAGEAEPVSNLVLCNVSTELEANLRERFSAELRGVNDQIEARLPSKYADDALRIALEEEATVISLAPVRASLESLFMTAVEESRE